MQELQIEIILLCFRQAYSEIPTAHARSHCDRARYCVSIPFNCLLSGGRGFFY